MLDSTVVRGGNARSNLLPRSITLARNSILTAKKFIDQQAQINFKGTESEKLKDVYEKIENFEKVLTEAEQDNAKETEQRFAALQQVDFSHPGFFWDRGSLFREHRDRRTF